jgi:AraC-like DNA-binding protein
MTGYPQLLQLAELFNYVEDVLAWAKDCEGRFLWVNRAIVMLRAANRPNHDIADGYREVLGKTDHDLCPAVLADQYQLDDDHVLAGNRIVNRIELFRHPDGTTCWHMTNKIPLFDEQGAVIGTAGVARLLKEADSQLVPGNEFGPVLAHMRDHYQSPITNDELARVAHMSVRAFERKFLRTFYLSPQKYLRKFRVRIASHTLVYTSQALSEVALSCGFADQSHFTREFRRQFGRTPREYRAHYASHPASAGLSTNSAVHTLETPLGPVDIRGVAGTAQDAWRDAPARRRKSDSRRKTGRSTPQLIAK